MRSSIGAGARRPQGAAKSEQPAPLRASCPTLSSGPVGTVVEKRAVTAAGPARAVPALLPQHAALLAASVIAPEVAGAQ